MKKEQVVARIEAVKEEGAKIDDNIKRLVSAKQAIDGKINEQIAMKNVNTGIVSDLNHWLAAFDKPEIGGIIAPPADPTAEVTPEPVADVLGDPEGR